MGARRRDDDHGLDTGGIDGLMRVGEGQSGSGQCAPGLGRVGVRVGHGHHARTGDTCQVADVCLAHAAGTQHRHADGLAQVGHALSVSHRGRAVLPLLQGGTLDR